MDGKGDIYRLRKHNVILVIAPVADHHRAYQVTAYDMGTETWCFASRCKNKDLARLFVKRWDRYGKDVACKYRDNQFVTINGDDYETRSEV